MYMDFQLLIITLFLVSLVARGEAATPAAPDLVKPGCNATCGNLTVPFPFGTKPGCYRKDNYNSFLITCNSSQPFLLKGNLPVLDISLDGQVRINASVSHTCFNESGVATNDSLKFKLRVPRFPVSNTRNKFTAVGCSTLAIYRSQRLNYTTGCVSLCDSVEGTKNGSCSGIGCCQASIPEGVGDFSVDIFYLGIRRNNSILKSLPCSYAFLAEEKAFNFSSLDLRDLQGRQRVPVVLDWAVGNETCEDAKKKQSSYACIASNSACVNSSNGPGYRCNCSSGYEGNPYLAGGCKDINECERSNPCFRTAKCENKEGSFTCSCKDGEKGDGIQSCRKKSRGTTYLSIALGITMGFLGLMVASSLVYFLLAKRKLVKLRQKFFEQNGGYMLAEKLNKHDGLVQTARIFTAEDLKKATNNYHESRVIGQGGYGTVYKGVISPNNREVAIKKSKVSDQSQIEQFINEVIILSQINHRNVVKLLGCCLETEVPMLVYEFITNGTLSEHIHDKDVGSSLSWEMRLKISAETAGAIAYLHSAISTPIIHRDIKSTNILLDENYTAKVADFGASKLVPLDHIQLTTLVQGTFGYLDPEYFHSSQLTEKSDVYSFGVLLTELITGEKAISFDRPEKDRNLATYFVSTVKSGHGMLDIVEKRLVEGGKKIQQIKEVAMLIERCLRVKGDERPSMKEVAMELEGMKMMVEHPWVDNDSSTGHKETEQLLNQSIPSDAFAFLGDGSSTSYSSTVGFDSMRDQMTRQLQLR